MPFFLCVIVFLPNTVCENVLEILANFGRIFLPSFVQFTEKRSVWQKIWEKVFSFPDKGTIMAPKVQRRTEKTPLCLCAFLFLFLIFAVPKDRWGWECERKV